MYINCLSPELEETLAYENANDIIHLEISDAAMLKAYFTEKVVKTLLDRQKMLVVIPDRMDSSIPSKILSNQNLAHLSTTVSTQGLGAQSVVRMKSLANLTEIPLLRQEYQHLLLKYKETSLKIHNTLSTISKRNIKSPSFKEMLLSIKPRPKANLPESLIEEIADMNLNNHVIKAIVKLQRDYKPRFVYMDDTTLLDASCIEDENSLVLARSSVEEIKQKVNSALLGLEEELYLMKRVIVYELEDEIAQWTKIKEELQTVFLENELDNYPSSFKDKGLPLINQLKGRKYLKFSLTVIPEIGWGQVSNVLSIISAIIDQATNSIDIYFEEYVRKLSPFNTSNKLLDDYIADAIQSLKEINQCKYIGDQAPVQFLQVDSLLKTLKSAHQRISLNHRALSDADYINFRIQVKELNMSQSLLEGLYHLQNEDWSGLIEFYGQRSHLMQGYDANMTRLSDWYEELASTQNLLKHTSHKEVHNRWHRIRDEALTDIRNTKWGNYSSVFESKEEVPDLAANVKELQGWGQCFFPIMIVQESQMKTMLQTTGFEFDQVFFMDQKDISLSDLKLFTEKDVNITIASTYSVDMSQVSEYYSLISNYISNTLISHSTKLAKLEKSDRYKYSLLLANNLLSSSEAVNIYKLGSKVIITTLDPLLNKRIDQSSQIESHNILYHTTQEPSHLVETFIHYDDITILLENDLLNDHNGMSTLWQHEVIKQLKNAGITIRNVFTHELYQDLNGTISQLVRNIMPAKLELKERKEALVV